MIGLGPAANAGTMESSSGSATAAPMPRRNVRRGRDFFVTASDGSHSGTLLISNGTLFTIARTSDENL